MVFEKLAFRVNETAALEAQGSQIRSRMSEKRDRKNDVIVYRFCLMFVGFGTHFGSQNRSNNDRTIYRIPESGLGGVVEIEARGGCQNVTFAL